ncbi:MULTISPECIES: hypothetical protein [unclassified Archaeoglobus]|jgi:predicted nucleic acid-binding Zn ribbon protein|nr:MULTISPECIES: hypothetical protein [unclassified Archaeoglobus]
MIAVKAAAALLGEEAEVPTEESCPELLKKTREELEKQQKLNLLLLILLALMIMYELFKGKRREKNGK